MRNSLVIVLGTVLLIPPMLVNASRLSSVNNRLAQADAQLTSTGLEAREILELRERAQRAEARKRPDQDLIAQVNAVLAGAGLLQSAFQGLANEGDTSVTRGGRGEVRYRRQNVRIRLSRLSPSDIGRFLAEWEAKQPTWAPTLAELVHARSSREPAGNLYDLSLLVSAVYVAPSERSSNAQ